MGTVAPDGSPWHQILQQMGQDWRHISGGQVELRIYPGGVLGDEPDMIQKMRIGQLQAVALSGSGLSRLEPAVACLQIPLLIDSYEELDYVRDRIAPRLEQAIEQKGYVVLNWGDAGWVHFFTKTPAKRLDDIRRMKLFIMAGDADTLELYHSAGFRPVPLATTDMLPALQTGLIDAFDVPPLLAMLNQWFGVAQYMIDIKWAPLVGATIVSKKTWERIPEPNRTKMLEAARAAGLRLRGEIRKMGDDAVEAMKKRGLKVITLDAATAAEWRREVEEAYPKLRGRLVAADLFDEVRRLRDEFRSKARGNPR
jgi:TRAP-type C4-dicarboxylate transport system substrate-binding protein